MKSSRRTYFAVLAVVLALVAALGAFGVLGADRDEPERTIASPAPAFATQTMYVSPGETGQSSGGDENADDSESDSDEQLQQEQQEAEQQQDEGTGEGFTPEGGGGRPGNEGSGDPDGDDPARTPDNPGSDPDPDPDPDDPARPGMPSILSNIGDYRTIGPDTAAPDLLSTTLQGRSGLDPLNRKLHFYAIPSDLSQGHSVLVEYANEGTGWQMRELAGSAGLFELPIDTTDGKYTDVTLTLVDRNGAHTAQTFDYRITYEAGDDPEDPGRPDDPDARIGPDIVLNVSDGQTFGQSPLILTVTATDHYDGSPIYADHITVTVEHEGTSMTIEEHGGQYAIDFDAFPLSGDVNDFTITVKARDYSAQAAESTEMRTISYEHHSYGEVIGQATIVVDATPVGLGIVATFSIDLHQGYAFPQDLIDGLTENGLRPDYSGSFGRSFYLSGLSSGGLFAGQSIDDELAHKIEQDKITYTGSHSADSLTDHDYTNTSGWLYNVNNSWWPSVSLDGYTASPGDTVYLIYSVAGGKDVGSPAGGTGGALSSYCGIWRNGVYTEMHDLSDYVVVREPTCSEDGEARYVCSVVGCGAWGSEAGSHADGQKIVLPATGEHEWVEDPLHSEEPSAGFDGVRAFKCTQCGEIRYEPWVCEHEWEDDPATTVAPTATADGVHGYVCSLCGETKTEVWHCDHSWVESGRMEPADGEDGWIEYTCTECGATKDEPLAWIEPEPDPDGSGGSGSGGTSPQSLAPQSARTPYAFFCAMSWRAL